MIKATMVVIAALAALGNGGCAGSHCMTEQECAAEREAWARLRATPSAEQTMKNIDRQNNDPYCQTHTWGCSP
jgi:hypothetical protein